MTITTTDNNPQTLPKLEIGDICTLTNKHYFKTYFVIIGKTLVLGTRYAEMRHYEIMILKEEINPEEDPYEKSSIRMIKSFYHGSAIHSWTKKLA